MALLALCAMGLPACGTQGVPLEELSVEPIAFVYWDNEDARRRKEIIEERAQAAESDWRPGVATVDSLRLLAEAATGGSGRGRPLERFPGRIALLDPQTLRLREFPANLPDARPLAWSADRHRLLFASRHRDIRSTQLYEYDLVAGELLPLTHGPRIYLEGDYGPDGRLALAWLDARSGALEAGLEVAVQGGGDRHPILDGTYPMGVRWSPKGHPLVYVDDQGPKDGRHRRDRARLIARSTAREGPTVSLAYGREPVFSPDGEWLVFVSETSKGWKLRRMRPDGSARAPLGASTRSERSPAISPDGQHVVYVSEVDGIDRLFVRRMDGTGDRILFEDGAAAFPVW